jgi:hypothetical protein
LQSSYLRLNYDLVVAFKRGKKLNFWTNQSVFEKQTKYPLAGSFIAFWRVLGGF